MDANAERIRGTSMFARKRRRIWPVVLAVVLLLVAALAAGAVYVARSLEFELRLRGDGMITQEYGEIYADGGVQAVLRSPFFGEYALTVPVICEGSVDSNTVGIYAITYQSEFLWLSDTAVRIVKITDTTAPVISLVEDEDFTLPGQNYIEDGFTAVDDYDGDISHLVEWTLAGNVMTYTVSDSSGNVTTVHRVINYDDPMPPSITLLGDRKVTVYLGLFVLSLLIVFRVFAYYIGLVLVVVGVTILVPRAFKKVDYGLIGTFAAFFVFSGNLARVDAVAEFLGGLVAAAPLLVGTASCQVISNVPSSVLLSRFTTDYKNLLMAVNIGGLGTPIASLASLITLGEYRRRDAKGVGRYLLKFSLINFSYLIILLATCLLVGLIF